MGVCLSLLMFVTFKTTEICWSIKMQISTGKKNIKSRRGRREIRMELEVENINKISRSGRSEGAKRSWTEFTKILILVFLKQKFFKKRK